MISVLVSRFVLTVIGCGLLVAPLSGGSAAFLGFLVSGLGLSLLYLLVLTGLSLSKVLSLSLLLASLGFLRAFHTIWRSQRLSESWSKPLLKASIGWLLPIAVAIMYLGVTIGMPLDPVAWDARSIFFFHSKMIYFNGALNGSIEWLTQPIGWSHPAYPKLAASLGALIAQSVGYWNESLPKLSLLLILLPIFYGLAAFFEWSLRYFLLIPTLVLCVAGWWLWNGYMDGFVALFAAIGLLFLIEIQRDFRPEKFLAVLLSGALAAECKNEGMLISALFLALLSLTLRPLFSSIRWYDLKKYSSIALGLFIALAPVVIWWRVRKVWGLGNDLSFGPSGVSVAWERFKDPNSTLMILKALFWDRYYFTFFVVLILGYLPLAAAHSQRHVWKLQKTIGIFFLGYLAVIYWIFLTTYWLLENHLSLAADRVALVFWATSIVSAYTFFERSLKGVGLSESSE